MAVTKRSLLNPGPCLLAAAALAPPVADRCGHLQRQREEDRADGEHDCRLTRADEPDQRRDREQNRPGLRDEPPRIAQRSDERPPQKGKESGDVLHDVLLLIRSGIQEFYTLRRVISTNEMQRKWWLKDSLHFCNDGSSGAKRL